MTLDEALALVIVGDHAARRQLFAFEPARIREAAERHGVLPLVAESIQGDVETPPTLQASLQREARRHVATDIAREVELRALLDALQRAAIPSVLMKGAQLAYSLYSRAHCRPRLDTDLVIAAGDQGRADTVFSGLGYAKLPFVGGGLVTQQAVYEKRRDGLLVHLVDLHWRVANPHLFADVLTFDELYTSAVPVPRLSSSALGLAPAHALLLACVHRIAHHADSDQLIWLFDIHLLASSASPSDWNSFLELARERRVAAVCGRSLERAAARFGSRAVADKAASLFEIARDEASEPTSRYLQQGRSRAGDLMADLGAVGTWTNRFRLAYEHLIPSARYMREIYAPADPSPLAVLYARRIFRGTRKWMART